MRRLKEAAGASAQAAVDDAVRERVRGILADIRTEGDSAVRRYSEEFDQWSPESFRLSDSEIERIVAGVSPQVIEDIIWVQRQVREFAQRQRETMLDLEVETLPGVILGHRHVPIEATGAYVPGGRYPLVASAHMTIVTAKTAGVEHVTACTPPIRGAIPAETVAAMSLAGADEIYLLGGVQALGAMAYGTESMRPVHLIAGPGNAYVAEAKRQLLGTVGIDLVAGPTEILIVADETADPITVAVDLLSQAEHGPDSPAVLITTSEDVARETLAWVERILPTMPTKDFAEPAWRDFGEIVLCESIEEAYAVADSYAFEHVEILTEDPRRALKEMKHYGALFLGSGTCVSYGDKVIGTNHVLPTRGAARYTGGLWVGKYLRTVTYQEVTNATSSAQLGLRCGRASRVELFEGHARSGDIRAMRMDGGVPEWLTAAGLDQVGPTA